MSGKLKLNSGVAWCVVGLVLVFSGAGCDDDESGADAAHGGHDDDHGDDDDAATPHDHDAMIGPDSGATCPASSTLTYDNFGKDFMTKYCVRCHSSKLKGSIARSMAPDGHDFDTLAGIDLVAKHIDEYAAAGPDSTNTKMPLSGVKPTVDERKKLGEWLACDLPEN